MRQKSFKVAIICIIIGFFLFLLAGIRYGFKFNNLVNSDEKYVKKTFEVKKDEINEIKIETHNDKVSVVPTDGDIIKITYYTNKYNTYTEDLSMNKICLKKDKKFRIFAFDFSLFTKFEEIMITVEIPKDISEKLDVDTNNGTIQVSDLDFSKISLKSSNGRVELKNINTSEDLDIKTSNGSLTFENVKSSKSINASTSNGKINLDTVIAENEIELDTSNGIITIKDVVCMDFKAETSNGRIEADMLEADSIDIKTSNGKIDATIVGNQNQFTQEFKTSNGDKEIINNAKENDGRQKDIVAKTSNASLKVYFVDK